MGWTFGFTGDEDLHMVLDVVSFGVNDDRSTMIVCGAAVLFST